MQSKKRKRNRDVVKLKLMAKDKEAPTVGPIPTGNIDFSTPPSEEAFRQFSQDLYSIMAKYGINYMNVYWRRFEPGPPEKKSNIELVN